MFPAGVILKTNLLRIDHYQKPHVQTHVMPTMEYSVLTDDDQRSRFYLGREYYYYHHYDGRSRCLTFIWDATGHIHEIVRHDSMRPAVIGKTVQDAAMRPARVLWRH